eukprot:gene9404-10387_t
MLRESLGGDQLCSAFAHLEQIGRSYYLSKRIQCKNWTHLSFRRQKKLPSHDTSNFRVVIRSSRQERTIATTQCSRSHKTVWLN